MKLETKVLCHRNIGRFDPTSNGSAFDDFVPDFMSFTILVNGSLAWAHSIGAPIIIINDKTLELCKIEHQDKNADEITDCIVGLGNALDLCEKS